MAFKQLRGSGGTYIKWDAPKTVKGILVGFEQGTYQGRPTTAILLKQEDGSVVKVGGSANIANSGLYNEQPGVTVEFVFKGKGKTKGGQPFNDIEVYVDSPEPEPGVGAKAVQAPSQQAGEPVDTYETLVAKLQLTNPNGAKAVLAALGGLGLTDEAKTAKLRDFLKVQG
jgi:hypothetical protein